jgi:ubiquinone/menaquinone biosynthesis C-methylase UbiE
MGPVRVQVELGQDVTSDKVKIENQINNAFSEAKKARNEALSFHNFSTELLTSQHLNSVQATQNILERIIRMERRNVKDPLRVLFLVPHTSLFDVYAPIYSTMLLDPLFQPSVLAFKRADIESDIDEANTQAFFDGLGIAAHVVGFDEDGFYPSLQPESYDILFYTLGSAAYPEAYKPERNSQHFLTCYLSYGFLLSDQYEYQFNQQFHHTSWRIFASTTREKEMYDGYGRRLSSNVVVTGYPKFDLYHDVKSAVENRAQEAALAQHSNGRPLVIWAPHWTLGLIYPQLNLGSFDKFCMSMLEIFDEFPDIDFLFKPHPNLKYALEKTTFMNEESYAIYVSMIIQKPNVKMWQHGDYIELFAKSAGMITDSSSFLAEYLPSSHPLLFLDRPDRAKMTEVGEKIIELYETGFTTLSIRAFLQKRIRSGNDEGLQRRLEGAKNLLERSEKTASLAIVDDIKRALAISPSAHRKNQTFDPSAGLKKQKVLERNAQRLSNAYWDRQSEYNYESLFPERYANQVAFTEKALFPFLTKDSHVVDIGCADGWHSCLIARHCGSLRGYDLNAKFIDLARKVANEASLTNCTFIVADALALGPLDQIADAVLLSGLTTCMIDDADAKHVLVTAARALRPNKVLLLKDTLSLTRQSKTVIQSNYGAIYRSYSSYVKLVQEAGFDILNEEWIQKDGEFGSFMALAQKRETL